MTSAAQIHANRQNARRSTGPRTPLGLRASSQNARRHGLTAAPPAEAVLSHLRAILGDPTACPSEAMKSPRGTAALALATAEARLDQARAHTGSMSTHQPGTTGREEIEQAIDTLLRTKSQFNFVMQATDEDIFQRIMAAGTQYDERTLRAARRHLSEAHAARRKALRRYIRLTL
jgi:hypothetical protein